MSIVGYAGWPTYDMFLIVSFSSCPVYNPNLLRHNLNPQKLVSGTWVGSNIDTPRFHLHSHIESFINLIEKDDEI